MTRCSVCHELATKIWVNPRNPKDRAPYCNKHFKSISKAFGNFEELYYYEKNIKKNPLFVVCDDLGSEKNE